MEGCVTYTEDTAEWEFADYEGLKVGEIRRVEEGGRAGRGEGVGCLERWV